MKFPPITAELQYRKHGIKEFYIFRDPNDPTCPILIHFLLANKTFKEESRPGITCFLLFYIIVESVVRLYVDQTIVMSYGIQVLPSNDLKYRKITVTSHGLLPLGR